MGTRDKLGHMPAVADLRTKDGEHLLFLRLPFDNGQNGIPGAITIEFDGTERTFRLVGKMHGIPTYDECFCWHAPKELIVDETPVVTARVSDAVLGGGYDDLPDTTPAPPSSERS